MTLVPSCLHWALVAKQFFSGVSVLAHVPQLGLVMLLCKFRQTRARVAVRCCGVPLKTTSAGGSVRSRCMEFGSQGFGGWRVRSWRNCAVVGLVASKQDPGPQVPQPPTCSNPETLSVALPISKHDGAFQNILARAAF